MGNALAREAPPALQRPLSLAMRARLEVALAGLDGSGKSTLARALDIDSGQRPAAALVETESRRPQPLRSNEGSRRWTGRGVWANGAVTAGMDGGVD